MVNRVAAIATSNAGYSVFFDKSCKEVGGYEPSIIGLGKQWNGFASGMQYAAEWLQTIDPNDIVLMCDRYDVVITAPLDLVFDKFQAGESAGRDHFLVSSDVNGFIQRLYFGALQSQKCQINTGSYVMRAGPMYAMFTAILNKYAGDLSVVDDQRHITEYLNENRESVSVEVDKQELFLLYPPGNIQTAMRLLFKRVEGERYARVLDRYSQKPIALIHRPSNGDMNNLLRDIGYTVDKDVQLRPFYHLDSLFKCSKYYAGLVKGAIGIK